MNPLRIFISSVQGEFADERAALRDYIRGDPLIRRFFEVFLFEDAPASDRRPDQLYLDEVERCDIYAGLFGTDYGSEDDEGVSPTEREFDHATAVGVHRLIFLKATGDERHPKMQALIRKAQAGLIRKRFNSLAELVAGLYAALVEYLESKELIRWGPFDASPCARATLDDLDVERMAQFVRTARVVRQFPLPEGTPAPQLLEHLNLLNECRPTNAAILLFGNSPQRFLISSEIRCAHFHGTEVAKPIPSYQVYKGTAFELVDQAVDFVLSKINRRIGTRAESARAPRTYEIPRGSRDRSHRQCGSASGLHGQRQRAGHAVLGPPGGPQPRPASATVDPGESAGSAPFRARQPVAGGGSVSDRVHRTHGNGNAGHDSALRRDGPAGTRVRRRRRLRDHDSPGGNSEKRIQANDGGGGSGNR